jgi:hypothetical protein
MCGRLPGLELLLIGLTAKTVRQDEKRGGPQANEDAEAFSVCLGVGRVASGQEPDCNRSDDRGEPEEETDAAELAVLRGLHGVFWLRTT